MGKKGKAFRKQIIAGLIILVVTIIGITSIRGNVSDNFSDITEKQHTQVSEAITTYCRSVLKNQANLIQQVSAEISRSGKLDKKGVSSIFERPSGLFSAFSLMDIKGETLYGKDMGIKLSEEEFYDSIVISRKTIFTNRTAQGVDTEGNVYLFTPVVFDGEVTNILAGKIHTSTIKAYLERIAEKSNIGVFLMNSDSRIIVKNNEANRMIGENDNYLGYMDSCTIKNDTFSIDDIKSSTMNTQKMVFYYTDNHKEYSVDLTPDSNSGWYVGVLFHQEDIQNRAFALSQKSIILLVLMILLWGGICAYVIILVGRNRKLMIDKKRYEIVSKMEGAVLFEFQFSPKRLEFYGDMIEMFGTELDVLQGESVYEVYQYVHEDDKSVRGRIHQFYDGEAKQFTAEIRICNSDKSYGWYRIQGVLDKDLKTGANRRFLGKIEYANQKIEEEKNLVQRAENDLLTGVLNKKTMEEKVTACLQNITGNIHYIFFMIDLDNFKNVNDNLGHIYGDKAIVDTAKRLTEIFHNNAYVGRLGGDEFAVCVSYDAFDEESLKRFIKKKAEKICEVNRRTYVNGEKEVSITSSVGIAIAPDFARDFESIYNMADKALYRSKNGGKNCYHVYEEK